MRKNSIVFLLIVLFFTTSVTAHAATSPGKTTTYPLPHDDMLDPGAFVSWHGTLWMQGETWDGSADQPALFQFGTDGTLLQTVPGDIGESGDYGDIRPVVGADDRIWGINKQRQIAVFDGTTVTQYPSSVAAYYGPIKGPDGLIWFSDGKTLVNMNAQGRVQKKYRLPAQYPDLLTTLGGYIWFYDQKGDQLWRMNMSGHFTAFALPQGSNIAGMVASRGTLWLTDETTNSVLKFSTTGAVTSYPAPADTLPTCTSQYHQHCTNDKVGDITSDGNNLYFTQPHTSRVVIMTPNGEMHPYDACVANLLTVGPDGNLWYPSLFFDYEFCMTTLS